MPRYETKLQFRAAPRVQGLVTIPRAESDTQRADTTALGVEETLAAAVGVHLDRWGIIIGERRGVLGDDDYRRVLLAVCLARRAGGVPRRIIEVAEALTGSPVEYLRWGVAEYRLTIDTSAGDALSAQLVDVARRILQYITPAGVNGETVEARGFRFDVDPGFDDLGMGRIL